MINGASEAESATVLDGLFPVGAVTVLCRSAQHNPIELGPSELQFAARLAPARLMEFRHGRHCARRALARLGAGAQEIPVGLQREPLWPSGVVGSISHAGPVAAAVVGWQHVFSSLGLDLEPAVPLEQELVARICLPVEIERMSKARDAPLAAKQVFGMKEAVYKALWPVLREFLDFHDIEVRVDDATSTFSAVSHTRRCPEDLAARLRGRIRKLGGLFAAGAVLAGGS